MVRTERHVHVAPFLIAEVGRHRAIEILERSSASMSMPAATMAASPATAATAVT